MNVDKWVRKNLTIPLWQLLNGNYYYHYLKFVHEFHENSLEENRIYQFRMLKKILEYTYHSVPFYQKEWNDLGIHPKNIKCFEDFENIPQLTKQKFRKFSEEFIALNSDLTKLIKSGTGGTTDSPITLYYDWERAKIKDAETHYFRKWFNWLPGDKVAFLWGATGDIPNLHSFKYNLLNRLTYNNLTLFSSFLNDKVLYGFVEKFNKFRPDVFQGYSNPVYILSEFILKNKIHIHTPKSIVLTAEPCLPYQREIIRNAFRCEVYTFYGCREGGYVGIECRHHEGYHINCSSVYVEFADNKGKRVAPGKLGNILLTDLYNYQMPLIRYQIGDIGTFEENDCICGSKLPLMNFLAGRETDVFITPDGSMIPGVSLTGRVIEDCRGIEQLQLIQNKIDELQVKIVKGPEYTEYDRQKLYEKLNEYFMGKLQIREEFVPDIPKEKSGKTRFCISNIPKYSPEELTDSVHG